MNLSTDDDRCAAAQRLLKMLSDDLDEKTREYRAVAGRHVLDAERQVRFISYTHAMGVLMGAGRMADHFGVPHVPDAPEAPTP